jgi:hypothetical protein
MSEALAEKVHDLLHGNPSATRVQQALEILAKNKSKVDSDAMLLAYLAKAYALAGNAAACIESADRGIATDKSGLSSWVHFWRAAGMAILGSDSEMLESLKVARSREESISTAAISLSFFSPYLGSSEFLKVLGIKGTVAPMIDTVIAMTRHPLFVAIIDHLRQGRTEDARAIIGGCTSEEKFPKQLDKYFSKVLPPRTAATWIEENLAYGDEIRPDFAAFEWDFFLEPSLEQVNVSAKSRPGPDEGLININGMMVETLIDFDPWAGEDFGLGYLASECANWRQDQSAKRVITNLSYAGGAIPAALLFYAMLVVCMYNYVRSIEKLLIGKAGFKGIQFCYGVSVVGEGQNRIQNFAWNSIS